MKVTFRSETYGRFNVLSKASISRRSGPSQRQHRAKRAAAPDRSATLRLFIAVCEERNLRGRRRREGIGGIRRQQGMADFELAFGVTLFERLSKAWC